MAKEKSTEIMKLDVQYPALAGGASAIQEALAVNLAGEEITPFDLDRVRVPTGGGTSWEVPNVEGDTEPMKDLDGIIVFTKVGRSYWAVPFDDAGGNRNSPPDCSSSDLINGIGDPGGKCIVCPLSQFGTAKSGKGRGQACRVIRFLFILRPGGTLPIVLGVPPTSLKPIKRWLLRISQMNKPYWAFVTRFSLLKTKNSTGIEYSQIVPRVVRPLEADELQVVSAYASAMKTTFEQYREQVAEETEDIGDFYENPAPSEREPGADDAEA